MRCAASACSSWPSATEGDANSAGSRSLPGSQANAGISLADATERGALWPGPDATNRMRDAETKDLAQAWQAPATDSFRSRGGDRKDEPGLDRQARQWVSPSAQLFETADLARMEKRRGKLKAKGINGNGFGLVLGNQAQVWAEGWPGPAMRDYKGSNSAAHLEVSTGSLHLDQLPNFVEHLFLPLSCPAPPIPLGPSCSPAGPNGSPPSVRRKLNPLFVEALMRWPIGLSGFARRETEWTRWWQLMPSLLSDLGSREPVQMDLFE